MLSFTPVTLADKAIINNFLQNKPPHIEEQLFSTLYAWQAANGFEWGLAAEKWLVIKTTFQGQTSFFPPIGSAVGYDQPLRELRDYCAAADLPLIFTEVIGRDLALLQKYLPQKPQVERDRAAANYIYRVSDLIDLRGRTFHQKRNHISQFQRESADARFVPLDAAMLPACQTALDCWCRDHNCDLFPSLAQEKDAIERLFQAYNQLDLVGECIVIQDQVVAFTIGERLNRNCAMIHIEKATSNLRGAYAAINQHFLKTYFADCSYVNRAEDLGEENLRRTKLGYNPVLIRMKYIVTC